MTNNCVITIEITNVKNEKTSTSIYRIHNLSRLIFTVFANFGHFCEIKEIRKMNFLLIVVSALDRFHCIGFFNAETFSSKNDDI